MKKFLTIIFICVALFSNAQLSGTACHQIESEASNGVLVFKHEGKYYLVSLDGYDLHDIYTGNILLINYTDKKKGERVKREWDLFLMNKRFKTKMIK